MQNMIYIHGRLQGWGGGGGGGRRSLLPGKTDTGGGIFSLHWGGGGSFLYVMGLFSPSGSFFFYVVSHFLYVGGYFSP